MMDSVAYTLASDTAGSGFTLVQLVDRTAEWRRERRRALLEEAKALRQVAELIVARNDVGQWMPGPFTASSWLRARGLLPRHIYDPLRARVDLDRIPGERTEPDEWVLACLFCALEAEDEAAALKPPHSSTATPAKGVKRGKNA